MKFLIADDDGDTREFLKSALESRSHIVTTATNGVEALEMAIHSPPEMIISDILMPEMDGFMLCREIKTNLDLSNIPFVFYSGTYMEPEHEKLGLALGASAFIRKPMEPDLFIQTIAGIISEHQKHKLTVPTALMEDEVELEHMHENAVVRMLGEKVKELEKEVSARKFGEESIRKKEANTRQIIDMARDAFVSMNTEGIITDWNPRAEEIFGWSREEALGRLMTETIIPPELREAHVKGLECYLATGEGTMFNQQVEITARHCDGHTIPVELSIVSQQTSDTINFNAFIRDISEQVRAREAHEKSREQLRRSLIGTVVAVSRAVGARDPYTAGHQQRVSQLARTIAQEMGLDSERVDGLRMGASIHDIGKIYLPAEILSKPTKLSNIEYELIKSHSQVGYDILKDIAFPWPVADIAHQHHERLDGTGYPQGLKGEEICLEARIVAVADVVEAMASHRPYRPALGIEKALAEINRGSGNIYDAEVARNCLKVFKEKGFDFENPRLNEP